MEKKYLIRRKPKYYLQEPEELQRFQEDRGDVDPFEDLGDYDYRGYGDEE